MPIDNNDVEQLMKQVAIGRKNWLFIGSIPAGERAANFLTLVSSALRNDLDVYTYIKAVLDALLAGSTDYASLRPDRWAAAHPEAIRVYRQEERRDRFARKTARRAPQPQVLERPTLAWVPAPHRDRNGLFSRDTLLHSALAGRSPDHPIAASPVRAPPGRRSDAPTDCPSSRPSGAECRHGCLARPAPSARAVTAIRRATSAFHRRGPPATCPRVAGPA